LTNTLPQEGQLKGTEALPKYITALPITVLTFFSCVDTFAGFLPAILSPFKTYL